MWESYYNEFENLHIQSNYVDSHASIKTNIETQNPVLVLKNVVLPDIKNLIWVKQLEINKCKMDTFLLPPFLEELTINNCNIILFDASVLPTSIKKLKYNNNNTKDIVGLFENLIDIEITNNNFRELNSSIPQSTQTLNLSNNTNLKLIPFIPNISAITYLNVCNTRIKSIDNVNNTITNLLCSNCKIKEINSLPTNLQIFICQRAMVTKINCSFPEHIEIMDLSDNILEKIPQLPNNIKQIDLKKNNLIEFPKLPESLQIIDLLDNKNLEITDEIRQLLVLKQNIIKIEEFKINNTEFDLDELDCDFEFNTGTKTRSKTITRTRTRTGSNANPNANSMNDMENCFSSMDDNMDINMFLQQIRGTLNQKTDENIGVSDGDDIFNFKKSDYIKFTNICKI